MNGRKIAGLKRIQEVKQQKNADIKDHFSYSSTSNVKIMHDNQYYQAKRTIQRKIINNV